MVKAALQCSLLCIQRSVAKLGPPDTGRPRHAQPKVPPILGRLFGPAWRVTSLWVQQRPTDFLVDFEVRVLGRHVLEFVVGIVKFVGVDNACFPQVQEPHPPPLGVPMEAQTMLQKPILVGGVVVVYLIVVGIAQVPTKKLERDLLLQLVVLPSSPS